MFRCPVCAWRYGLDEVEKRFAAAAVLLAMASMALFAFFYHYHYHWLVQ